MEKASFCIICCKSSSKRFRDKDKGPKNGRKALGGGGGFDRFLKLLESYVGEGKFPGALEVMEVDGFITACEKCEELLKPFCELFYELIRIRLLMDWKLEGLIRHMEGAGRVPARMRSLKTILDEGKDDEGTERIFRNIVVMRSEIVKRCNDKLSKSRPEVNLDRELSTAIDHKYAGEAKGQNEFGELMASLLEPMGEDDANYYSNEDLLFGGPESLDNDDLEEHLEPEQKYYPDDDDNDQALSSLDNIDNQNEDEEEVPIPQRSFLRRARQIKRYQESSDSDSEPELDNPKTDPDVDLDLDQDLKQFICVICSKGYSWKYKNNVIRHLRDSHSMSLQEAKDTFRTQINNEQIEKKVLQVKTQAQSHQHYEDPADKPFKCKHCFTGFSYQITLERHLEKFHSTTVTNQQAPEEGSDEDESNSNSLPCTKCSRKFRNERRLYFHMKKYHEVDVSEPKKTRPPCRARHQFTCSHCRRTFSFKQNLLRHIRGRHRNKPPTRHPEIKTEPAEPQPITDDNEDNLKEAEVEATEALDIDNVKQTDNHQDLKLHKDKEKSFKCPHCDTGFSYEITLERHLKKFHNEGAREDTTENAFICETCSSGFRRKRNLYHHLRKYHPSSEQLEGINYTTVRNNPRGAFNCQFCQKMFTFKSNLSRHLKSCRKNKKKSTKTVTGPESDSEDEKGSVGGGDNFNVPVPRRSNPRGAFSCHFCDQIFSFQSNLSRHIKSRHKNKRSQLKKIRQLEKAKKAEIKLQPQSPDDDLQDNDPDGNDDIPSSSDSETPSKNQKPPPKSRYKYCCKLCPKKFTFRQNLYRHRKEDHPMSSSSECLGTGPRKIRPRKKKMSASASGDPTETKYEINRYLCPICSKTLTWKSNVMKHLRHIHKFSLPEAKTLFETQVKKLETDDEIEMELDSNNTTKPFSCDHCFMGFTSDEAHRRHLKKYHSNPNVSEEDIPPEIEKNSLGFKCPICKVNIKFRGMLNVHLRRYHHQQMSSNLMSKLKDKTIFKEGIPVQSKVIFNCTIPNCSENFKDEDDFKEHQNLHGSFNCNFCEVTKDYAPDLALHELKNHQIQAPEDNPVFKCSRCDFTSNFRPYVISHHLKTHLNLNITLLTCDICQAQFHLKDFIDSNETDHFQSHHSITGVDDIEMKRCDYDNCQAYFLQPSQLFLHKLKIHKINDRKRCPDCRKEFTLDKNMRRHLKLVHNYDDENPDLPIPCKVPDCKKRFSSQEEMIWHSQYSRHQSPRDSEPINCPDCDKICIGPDGLRIHKKIHDRPSTFICELCGKEFKLKRLLKQHKIFHMDKDTWEHMCQECGKKFPTSSGLERHRRCVHLGERRFQCPECGKGFSQRDKLRNHLKGIHHKDVKVDTSDDRKVEQEKAESFFQDLLN